MLLASGLWSVFGSDQIVAGVVEAKAVTIASASAKPTVANPSSRAQIPVGWKLFTGRGLEMYLPANWQGGSEKEMDAIFENLKTMGPSVASLARQLEAQRSQIRFFVYDSETLEKFQGLANINVTRIYNTASPIEMLVKICQDAERIFKQAGGAFKCIQQKQTIVGTYKEAGYIIFEEYMAGVSAKGIQYLIKQGNYFWQVTLTSAPEDIEKYQTIFETAMETFRITE